MRWAWLIPAISLGLYLGRIVSEWFLASWPLPVAITLITIGISIALLRRQPIHAIWPLSLLLLYVFYPFPDPSIAIGAAAIVIITLALLSPMRIDMGERGLTITGIGIAALLLVIGSLTLYLATISPDILPADSGEFQLIASELGIAHPPGFPLYSFAHFSYNHWRRGIGDQQSTRTETL